MKFLIKHFKLIVTLLILGRLVLAFGAYHPDIWNNMDWGVRFFQYGPQKFYAPESNVWSYTWPNQPPGSILLFAFMRKVFEATFNGIFWVNVHVPPFPSIIIPFLEQMLYPAFLKLPSILCDLGISLLILKITKSKFASIVFLVNPVVWYNSAIWGQTDAVISFLALFSFYLLSKKKVIWAFLFLALCFYVKISLLIFAPVFLLYLFKLRIPFTKVLVGAVISFVVIASVTFVFSRPVDPVSWLYFIYTRRVLFEQLQVITANAFNIWVTIAGINEQPQTLLLGPLSYQTWGIVFFGVVYLFILVKFFKSKKESSLWWTLAGTAFASWMLLTNMHERYLYPLFPYFTILLADNPSLLPLYSVVSGINLLNMYNFWFVPAIKPVVSFLTFSDRIMTRVFGIIDFVLFTYFLKYGFLSGEVATTKKGSKQLKGKSS